MELAERASYSHTRAHGLYMKTTKKKKKKMMGWHDNSGVGMRFQRKETLLCFLFDFLDRLVRIDALTWEMGVWIPGLMTRHTRLYLLY